MTKPVLKAQKRTAALMKAGGHSQNAICKATNLHHTSIKRIMKEPAVIEDIAKFEKQLSDSFGDTAARALASIDDTKLETASARDLGVLAGICVDKQRLISGQSTQNVAMMCASAVIQAQEEIDRRNREGLTIENDPDEAD